MQADANATSAGEVACNDIMEADDSGHVVRLAKQGDLAAIGKLHLDGFIPDDMPSLPLPIFMLQIQENRVYKLEKFMENVLERYCDGSDFCIAETENGIVLGAVDISDKEMKSAAHNITEGLYLSSMVVDPAYRRLGIASELLQAAENQAVARGAACMWLFVQKDNDAAMALYERHGYEKQPFTHCNEQFAMSIVGNTDAPLFCKKLSIVEMHRKVMQARSQVDDTHIKI
jgi:GNAT superfamily N-acetyltransferase